LRVDVTFVIVLVLSLAGLPRLRPEAAKQLGSHVSIVERLGTVASSEAANSPH